MNGRGWETQVLKPKAWDRGGGWEEGHRQAEDGVRWD